MNARERYYLNHHLFRLSRWQTEKAIEIARQRAIARRNVRLAAIIYRERVKAIAAENAAWYARVMTDAFSAIR